MRSQELLADSPGTRAAAVSFSGSISSPKTALPGCSGCLSLSIGDTIESAAGPEMRTTPMPPRPGGVAIATIVSSRFTQELYKFVDQPLRRRGASGLYPRRECARYLREPREDRWFTRETTTKRRPPSPWLSV